MGTIIHNKGSVRGLTTAASIWVTACIGLAIGMGYYFLSFASAISVYIIIVFVKKIEGKFFEKTITKKLDIEYYSKGDLYDILSVYFKTKNIQIKDVAFSVGSEYENKLFRKCNYTILVSRTANLNKIQGDLNKIKEVINAVIL